MMNHPSLNESTSTFLQEKFYEEEITKKIHAHAHLILFSIL